MTVSRLGLVRPPLPADAQQYLDHRGVSGSAARKRGLRALTAAQSNIEFEVSAPALQMPYYDVDGKPLLNRDGKPFMRARLFHGSSAPANAPKFLPAAGTGNHFYLDPARKNWRTVFADPAIRLAITEGEVKAMCATDHGIDPCIGLPGVHGWMTRVNGLPEPLSDFDAVEWAGRIVELAFDSDAVTKPEVLYTLHGLAAELMRRGAEVLWVAIPPGRGGAKQGLDDFLMDTKVAGGDPLRAYRALARTHARALLSADEPMPAARTFLGLFLQPAGTRLLHRYSDAWYGWDQGGYNQIADGEMRAHLYGFLERATEPDNRDGKVGVRQYQPSSPRVSAMIDALSAKAHLEARQPCWLDGRKDPPPHELISCKNGLLHVPTRKLIPLTPHYFSTAAPRNFDYDLRAPEPARWKQFLGQLFEFDDRGNGRARDTLQEMFGYLLTADTRQQKIFLIVGPKRAGKGTLMRVLTGLIGKANIAGPTLASLGENFGLQALIDKPLAIVADARLGGTDQRVLTERLLAISGEDTQTVDRKYREPWTGVFPTRFVIVTNELPRLNDASGALPSRFLPIMLQRSFFGKEDQTLTEKLLTELPGIFNWALAGLDRLRTRGHFGMPDSSKEAVQDLGDLASPVAAFVRDRCTTGAGLTVICDDLHKAYRAWAEDKGYAHIDAQSTFGRNLKAHLPGVGKSQPRAGGGRIWTYVGIALCE